MKEKKSRLYNVLSSLDEIKWSVALKGIITGFVAGILVVWYRIIIEFGIETSVNIYGYLHIHPLMILPWIAFVAVAGLIFSWLLKIEPMATGSGIPQVEGLLLYGLKIRWYSVLLVRFAGGALASFFGLSLGREGPSIQIGASCSQALAEEISKNKIEENYLITGGAAAGLSAAFSAPLSGIVFALEEVHRSFSPIILIAATTASLTADVVSKYFFGLKPVLSFGEIPQLPISLILLLLPLGVLSGLVGAAMNKGLLGFQTLCRRLPRMLQPYTALLVALPFGLFLPQTLGGGQDLIRMSENAKIGIVMLLVLMAAKLIFTCISFGSGVPGGIFMPILATGALVGSLFGNIATHFGVPAQYIPDFVVCAMAGALSGSVKAPVTSILLMAEMTGSLVHMLPVAVCSFTALLFSDILKVTPIYEALLERVVENNQEIIKSKKAGALLEVPVEFGSCVAGKMIREVEWPQGMLIVAIHRGEKEIVPKGSTRILQGDYLIILSSEDTYSDIYTKVRNLCNAN